MGVLLFADSIDIQAGRPKFVGVSFSEDLAQKWVLQILHSRVASILQEAEIWHPLLQEGLVIAEFEAKISQV